MYAIVLFVTILFYSHIAAVPYGSPYGETLDYDQINPPPPIVGSFMRISNYPDLVVALPWRFSHVGRPFNRGPRPVEPVYRTTDICPNCSPKLPHPNSNFKYGHGNSWQDPFSKQGEFFYPDV